MRKTATDLRAHLYEVLDHVVLTGEPVIIERKGVELCLARKPQAKRKSKRVKKLANLIVGDPDDLIHMEWPWSGGNDL
jgi:antitoxin (DNA-binding transcriptional repressor) of toxin-antitoxin stability system